LGVGSPQIDPGTIVSTDPPPSPLAKDFPAGSPAQGQWYIRWGAEPIDLHLSGPRSRLDRFIEKIGITAGPGSIFNHNYFEVVNGDGQVVKRIQGLGLNEKWEMSGTGRLVGLVVDGHYTRFSDDPLQRHDPHPKLHNQLQHADRAGRTKEIYRGSEQDVLSLYGGMIRATLDINNRGPEFFVFGQDGPNSNGFHATLFKVLRDMTAARGEDIRKHDPPGWDIGLDRVIPGIKGQALNCTNLDELRQQVTALERLAAEQRQALVKNISAPLQTTIPDPACPSPPPPS
jgi:hypothetical protein